MIICNIHQEIIKIEEKKNIKILENHSISNCSYDLSLIKNFEELNLKEKLIKNIKEKPKEKFDFRKYKKNGILIKLKKLDDKLDILENNNSNNNSNSQSHSESESNSYNYSDTDNEEKIYLLNENQKEKKKNNSYFYSKNKYINNKIYLNGKNEIIPYTNSKSNKQKKYSKSKSKLISNKDNIKDNLNEKINNNQKINLKIKKILKKYRK
jgi:hypothetical protein